MEATDQVGLKIHLAGKKHIMKLAQADSVVNVNPVDTSVLKNEFVNKTMEKSQNICDQSAAPDKTKESDKKMNENETDFDKQHKKNLEVSQAKVFY